MALLGHAGLGSIFVNHGDNHAADVDDNEDEDNYYPSGRLRRRTNKCLKNPPPPVPSVDGTQLMRSGIFGCTENFRDELRRKNKRLARRLLSRELGAEHDHLATQARIVSQVSALSLEQWERRFTHASRYRA